MPARGSLKLSADEAYLNFYTIVEKEVWEDPRIPMDKYKKEAATKQEVRRRLKFDQHSSQDPLTVKRLHTVLNLLVECKDIKEPVMTAERSRNQLNAIKADHERRLRAAELDYERQIRQSVHACINSRRWNTMIAEANQVSSGNITTLRNWAARTNCVINVDDHDDKTGGWVSCSLIHAPEARKFLVERLEKRGYVVKITSHPEYDKAWRITLNWQAEPPTFVT